MVKVVRIEHNPMDQDVLRRVDTDGCGSRITRFPEPSPVGNSDAIAVKGIYAQSAQASQSSGASELDTPGAFKGETTMEVPTSILTSSLPPSFPIDTTARRWSEKVDLRKLADRKNAADLPLAARIPGKEKTVVFQCE